MRLTPGAAVLLAGCAGGPVQLECIGEATFEQQWGAAVCRAYAYCGNPSGETEDECVERLGTDGLSEAKQHLLDACPHAKFDGCEAAACLDQLLHSPPECGPISALRACGTMDWYHGLCPEFSGTE